MLDRILSRIPFGKGFVLCLHGVKNKVAPDSHSSYMDQILTDFNEFKTVIKQLKRFGFIFISMRELLDISRSGFKTRFSFILLTVDDGYQNNYTHLHPFLKKNNIPWTLFVSTNHIEKQVRFYTYRIRCSIIHTHKDINIPKHNLKCPSNATLEERKNFYKKVNNVFKYYSKINAFEMIEYFDSLLSTEEWDEYNSRYHTVDVLTKTQLVELANDPLVEVGSHNHNHLIITDQFRKEDIYYEMKTSKDWLQQNLNIDPFYFCYPNGKIGNFSNISKRICQELDYKLAFTFVGRMLYKQTDLYEIPRFGFPTPENINRLSTASKLPEIFFKIKNLV